MLSAPHFPPLQLPMPSQSVCQLAHAHQHHGSLVLGMHAGVVSYVVRRRGSSTSEWLAVAQSGVGSGLPGPSSMLALPDGCLAVASGERETAARGGDSSSSPWSLVCP